MTTDTATTDTARIVEITPRLDFASVAPGIYKALLALDTAARRGHDPVLVELVQIRASQINRCAYCIAYHTRDARRAGEREERIYQLDAWAEASLYTDAERAALALTEAVTRLPGGVGDDIYAEAARHFSDTQLAGLIALIFTVNCWNRMNVTTRKTPGTL